MTSGAAACGNAEAGTTATSPAPTPAETLLDAVPDEAAPAFAFATTGGCVLPFTGVFDAPGKAVKTSITQKIPRVGSIAMTFLAIGEDRPFARITTKPASLATRMGVPKTWMALDPAKIADLGDSPLSYDGKIDPLGMGELIQQASGVVREGARYTGTVDLTKIEEDESVIASAALTKLGDKAEAVPFEAVVDEASGNLTTLKLKIPSGKACTLTYDRFGEVKSLSAPTAKKAPAGVYALLNS
ncbi:hypothetical protein [Actinoplanes sp. GCM10030250]|uniref:hypothetical protein n=1 Tax=Actinoplanes sp. GCM10030250 TaxID=3273376 RepID=UPI00360ED757